MGSYRFCSQNFGDTSSLEMWNMFCSTIENLFDEPANLEIFPPNAYIHLLYAVCVSGIDICSAVCIFASR